MPRTGIPLVKSLRMSRQIYFGLVMMLGAFFNSPAQAQELDGAALEQLALRGTWAAEYRAWGNWSWNEDKTVCFRLGDTEGECYDTGSWVINENVICYELTWVSLEFRKDCYTVQALGDGRYETLHYGTAMVSTAFYFKVLE